MPKATPSPSKVAGYSPYRRPINSPQKTSSTESSDPSNYKLNFGSYAGSTLKQVRPSYIQWLIKEKIPENRPDLKKAIEVFQQKSNGMGGRRLYGTPSKSRGQGSLEASSPRTPTNVIDFDGGDHSYRRLSSTRGMSASNSAGRYLDSEVDSTPSRKRQVINLELMDNPSHSKDSGKELDHIPYVLDFGKHNGFRLSKVPLTYIDFLAQRVMEHRPSLKQALIDEGFVDALTGELIPCHTMSKSQSPTKVKPQAKDVTQQEIERTPYVLSFGKHQGLTIPEVPISYLAFLAKECMGTMPPLQQALTSLGLIDPSTQQLHTYRTFSRFSQFPSIHNAPSVFQDEMSLEPLWITQGDIFHNFQMSTQQLDGLSQVRKNCYHLFHVYELFKRYRGETAAKAALLGWMRLKQERENNTMIGMGLGGLLYNDPRELYNGVELMAFMRGIERPSKQYEMFLYDDCDMDDNGDGEDEEDMDEDDEDEDEDEMKEEPKVKNERFNDKQRIKEESRIKDERKIKDEPKIKQEPKVEDQPNIKGERGIKVEPVVKNERRLKDEPKVKGEPNINHEIKVKEEPTVNDELEIKHEQKVKKEPNIKHEVKIKEER